MCSRTRARPFQTCRCIAYWAGCIFPAPPEKIIPDTVAALREFNLTYIAAGHCTGWRAMTALANAFGDQVVTPTAVGKRFVF